MLYVPKVEILVDSCTPMIKKKSTSFFIFSPYFVTNTLLITSYGIGVGATMDTTKVDEKEVLVSRKIKAEEGLVEGTFEVLRPGMHTLRIEFDNTYSYLRSKSIQYRFDVDESFAAVADSGEIEVGLENLSL